MLYRKEAAGSTGEMGIPKTGAATSMILTPFMGVKIMISGSLILISVSNWKSTFDLFKISDSELKISSKSLEISVKSDGAEVLEQLHFP